ncbi:hypothetical protein AGLY_014079 [Aphis glycines]|uniref:Uncharacterized protein n=1 Tax=Aphis glycines TaxID=307491 RepID=A0A6G0T652_APHGL|nr:hypothetical protein AGLY_014079 [Aphis glycines]
MIISLPRNIILHFPNKFSKTISVSFGITKIEMNSNVGVINCSILSLSKKNSSQKLSLSLETSSPYRKKININIDSERSDECIDFTMIITSRNNASISNFGGGFRWKSEYPWCIIEVKMTEKQEFLHKTSFRLNRFFYMVVIQKLITFLISYSYSDLKIIRINRHNFFLLVFEVQILTKIRQNHEYFLAYNNYKKNLNFGVFRPLKHKPPFHRPLEIISSSSFRIIFRIDPHGT